jgi:hypothetical protein
MLKSPSLERSVVGRTGKFFGAEIRRPLCVPEMILIN